jgi:hypothetical protein
MRRRGDSCAANWPVAFPNIYDGLLSGVMKGGTNALLDVSPARRAFLRSSYAESTLAIVGGPAQFRLVAMLDGPFNPPKFFETSHRVQIPRIFDAPPARGRLVVVVVGRPVVRLARHNAAIGDERARGKWQSRRGRVPKTLNKSGPAPQPKDSARREGSRRSQWQRFRLHQATAQA